MIPVPVMPSWTRDSGGTSGGAKRRRRNQLPSQFLVLTYACSGQRLIHGMCEVASVRQLGGDRSLDGQLEILVRNGGGLDRDGYVAWCVESYTPFEDGVVEFSRTSFRYEGLVSKLEPSAEESLDGRRVRAAFGAAELRDVWPASPKRVWRFESEVVAGLAPGAAFEVITSLAYCRAAGVAVPEQAGIEAVPLADEAEASGEAGGAMAPLAGADVPAPSARAESGDSASEATDEEAQRARRPSPSAR